MADSYMINGQKVSGFSRNAKDIDFDPTGTDLQSTDAENAIKEVYGKLSVKKKEISGTTSATGNLNTGLSVSDYFLVGGSLSSHIVTVATASGKWWVHITDTAETISANQSVTLDIYYLEM